jgi:Flp pilus assembly protein TadG
VAPHHSRSQRGQAAILTIFALTTLIGMVALVIDVGVWRTERGHMVNAADAAALAGAANLNKGASSAVAVAVQAAKVNGATSANAVAYTTSSTAGPDTIKVTVTAPGKPYFAKLFGITGFDINATATARVYAYTALQSKPLFPIGVTPESIPAFGTEVTLKYGGGSCTTGNCGAIELPGQNNGCSIANGKGEWKSLLAGTDTPCTVAVGDTLTTEPGVAVGPTDQGLDYRIGSNSDTFDQVVRTDPNGGLSTIIDWSSPRLVEVPIVVNASDGSSTWPSGRSDVRVVGFAFFFITSWDGGEVKGQLVQATANLPTGSTGGVTGQNGVYKIKLIS